MRRCISLGRLMSEATGLKAGVCPHSHDPITICDICLMRRADKVRLAEERESTPVGSYRPPLKRLVNKRANSWSCVYLICDTSTGWVKIGWSRSAGRRLQEIQGSNPTAALIEAIPVPTRRAFGIERRLHKAFEAYRKAREWFVMDTPTINRCREMAHQLAKAIPPGVVGRPPVTDAQRRLRARDRQRATRARRRQKGTR